MHLLSYEIGLKWIGPGRWCFLWEYLLSDKQRKAQRRSEVQELQRRCELVCGSDDWRLHVDFGLPQSEDWQFRNALLARRPANVSTKEWVDWMRSRIVPECVSIEATELVRFVDAEPADWSVLWDEWQHRPRVERAGGDCGAA